MGNITEEKMGVNTSISKETLLKAYRLMSTAKAMTEKYEANAKIASKYVHATSRGHEAIQLAIAFQMLPQDYMSLYYRDDSVLLGIGLEPYELMLQLFAKKDDPFSGGRTYYCHPSMRRPDFPKIPHQSSATGMQAIPTTGIAMGIQYKELQGLAEDYEGNNPVVICSIGDAAMTEGEVAEALHMAALKQLPIIYLVQDNGWDISAKAEEIRTNNAADLAIGFKEIEVVELEGNDFIACHEAMSKIVATVRKERRPFLVRATVPLLNHHTSGVRMEWYRDDLEEHQSRDPFPILHKQLLEHGFTTDELQNIENKAMDLVSEDFDRALVAENPAPKELYNHIFAPTPVTVESGTREPEGNDVAMMVDNALFAVRDILKNNPEALLYGQDVGARLGGVFREAATLAQQFGDNRVFNTPIQEAFIIGSTVGMAAVGLKPIVEVQFADYLWPGLNQLFTEVSRSCYLTNGKWPVSCLIRVPVGAYISGGPYHSSSIESVLANIRGIKIVYPSNGADMKGLMKAAFYDPNPVVMLEHKGLYWSKIKGTESAKTVEPSEDYIIPLGKGRIVKEATNNNSLTIVTYGRGVYWALEAAKDYENQVEIIDLRTIYPLDEELIVESVKKCGKCLVVTEEAVNNSFAQAISGRVSDICFEFLDAPVKTIGSAEVPAVPLSIILEYTMMPSADKVKNKIEELLSY